MAASLRRGPHPLSLQGRYRGHETGEPGEAEDRPPGRETMRPARA